MTQDGDPRPRGVDYLRRAEVLDPRAAEAAFWLAWASMLDERHDAAETDALRGVEMDPDTAFSHFVLGWVRMVRGLRTGEWDKCQAGATAFRKCVELHPREFHALLPLGDLYALAGQRTQARAYFERALDVERSAASEYRSIGALTFLGLTSLQDGQLDDARKQLDRALVEYQAAEQFFAPYVRALTLCGLGDLDRSAGEYGSAAVRYLRARALLEPIPWLMGCGYLVIRLETRLALTYSRLRMSSEAMQHASAARSLTKDRAGYSFNWDWGVCEARLHYDWAVLHAGAADRQGVHDELSRAVQYGWRETQLLQHEPAFAGYRLDPAVLALLETAHTRSRLPE